MKFVDMKELTPYRVTKPSTDTTFSKDDIIWLSSNGDINSLSVVGWINPSECDSETLDFEVEKEKDFEVLAIKGHEICRRKANADGCDCCKGDTAVFWLNNENNAFVDSEGEMLITAKDRNIRFKVNFCPNCGREF